MNPIRIGVITGCTLLSTAALGANVNELEGLGQLINNTRGTAQAVAAGAFSVNASPSVFGSAPTVSLMGRSGVNDVDFYSFQTPGGAAYFDIDATSTGLDTYLALFDNSGTLLADDDDSFPPDAGSATDLDSFLGVIFLTPGTYFVAVASGGNFAVATGTGVDPFELFRPDGVFGGNRYPGADSGVSSFDRSGVQQADEYTLHITVPGPGSLALLALAPLLARSGRRRA